MKIFYKILFFLILSAVIIMSCKRENEKDIKVQKTSEVSFKEKMILDYLQNIGIDAFKVSAGDREIIHFESDDARTLLPYSEYNANPYGTVHKTGFFTMSVTKSWTSLLIGTLIDNEFIDGIDVLISDYVPDWKEGAGVTLHHLLTMTSGLENMSPEDGIIYKKDKNAFAKKLKPAFEPGMKWSYSNEAVQILSIFIENLTGKSLSEYAKETLFDPLEMDQTTMWMDKNGQTKSYADTITSIDDFHKIGLLIINKGQWKGHQIISEDWLAHMFTVHRKEGVQGYGYSGYGYLCWLDSIQGHDVYIFSGQQNSRCIMIPEKEIVISVLQKTVPESGPEGISLPYLLKTILEIEDETMSNHQKTLKITHRIQQGFGVVLILFAAKLAISEN